MTEQAGNRGKFIGLVEHNDYGWRASFRTQQPGAVFSQHVTQADKGCDFDFLHHGAPTPDPDTHH